MTLYINHNDGFIIDELGGPLQPEYESIHYHAYNHKFDRLTIEFGKDMKVEFYPEDLERYDYRDIIKYHKIRLDKNNMTKIQVISVGNYIKDFGFGITPISQLWEFRGGESGVNWQYYVGPKDEEKIMINKINEIYEDKEIEITIQNVKDSDLTKYEDDF